MTLINRDLLFEASTISGLQLSPDGRTLAFLKPQGDVVNVWTKASSAPFIAAAPVTRHVDSSVTSIIWAHDSKALFCIVRKHGSDTLCRVALRQWRSRSRWTSIDSIVTIANASLRLIHWPRTQSVLAYIAIAEHNGPYHLYALNLTCRSLTIARRNSGRDVQWVIDHNGQLRAIMRTNDRGGYDIVSALTSNSQVIFSSSARDYCALGPWVSSASGLYIITNADNNELTSVSLLNCLTGRLSFVHRDPLGSVDVDKAVFSPVTGELESVVYTDERPRRYVMCRRAARDYDYIARRFPGMKADITSRSANDRWWLVTMRSDTEPGRFYVFDRRSKTLCKQYVIKDGISRALFSKMYCESYKSSDGLRIGAYITRPRAAKARRPPLVVLPHGGPWARDIWGFNILAQFLANRGYVVLMPNYRGSSGFGRRHLDLADGEWGRLMQDDLTAGVKHLISAGRVDSSSVAIVGASYGGYAALAGAVFTPELYAAVVAINPPADLDEMCRFGTRTIRERTVARMRVGDPTTAVGRKSLRDQSPIYYIENIRCPVMVIQGGRDDRVGRVGSGRLASELRRHDVTAWYLVAGEEGHSLADQTISIAVLAAVERFLCRFIGGHEERNWSSTISTSVQAMTVINTTGILVT